MTMNVPLQNKSRIYVEVVAAFSVAGDLSPKSVRWYDGRVFNVDQVIDVRQATGMQAGGLALRFTCLVEGSPCFLFYEGNNKWFVQAR